MHYLYILHSPNHDKYYVGESADPQVRLKWHNGRSDNSYTKPYRPWVIVRSIEVKDYATARKMERYIKRQKSKTYVTRIVKDDKLVDWIKNKFNSSVG